MTAMLNRPSVCPPWCSGLPAGHPELAVTDHGEFVHTAELGDGMAITSCLDEGTRVWLADSAFTPSQARIVAQRLLEAATLADAT